MNEIQSPRPQLKHFIAGGLRAGSAKLQIPNVGFGVALVPSNTYTVQASGRRNYKFVQCKFAIRETAAFARKARAVIAAGPNACAAWLPAC